MANHRLTVRCVVLRSQTAMETDREETKPAKKWSTHISEHWGYLLFGVVAGMASIFAFGATPFPWLFSAKRELVYSVNAVRTPIVQTAKESPVTVSYRGTPVEGNVTAVQIAIWNAGREPIRHEDILSPIILSVGGGRG